MKAFDGTWVETIGYGHHASSGSVYARTASDMRKGIHEDLDAGTALTNESAKTTLRNYFHRLGYSKVTVLESEYPGSFIVKGVRP